MRRALIALAMIAIGCAPEHGDVYSAALAKGQRELHAGRYEDAARAFDDAAGKALRVKDRDEALFLAARSFEKSGRVDEARATYERLRKTSPDGPRAGRAAFDLAEIEIAHGSAEKGHRLLDDAARAYPNHGLTRLAIRRLVEHAAEKGGEPAALAWLKERRAAFEGTDQDEVIAYEIATSLRRAGRKQEAHDAFLATAARWGYPKGGFFTDALWDAADIDEELGRPAEAIEHLRALLVPREKAQTTGSYERPKYGPAQERIAVIYRDKLKDRASARREFHRLYTEFKLSTRRDDALWCEARLAREDGDRDAVCELAAKITREFPESRYAGCGRELCPGAPAGKKECARYIRRELGAVAPDSDAP